MTRTAHRICPICEACCGLEVTLEDDRITAIRGHESDVFSKGYICPKGVALKDLHEDPDRLRQPLVKRNGRFVAVPWDEAFAEIERRLPPLMAEHGRDAVAISMGNPVVHKFSLLAYGARLAKAIGSKNFYSASTLDQIPKQLACGLMYGSWLSVPVPDIERTDLLFVLGGNPMASNGSMWTVPDFRGKLKALKARGGRMIVVDPRRTETAELADEHLFVRPGADVFLLLAMVQALFAEGLVRLGRLAEHAAGLDALREAVAGYTPERVAARCGIEAATIRRIAREFATAPRAAFYARLGSCTQEYGTLTSWLADLIAILTGHFDREGGLMFPKAAAFAPNTQGKAGRGHGVRTGRYRSRVSALPEVNGELPTTSLAEEIQVPGAGQVKALVTLASNPVLSSPNGARLSAALDQLDFMVSVDLYLNETTRHADVILPGRSPLEDSHFDAVFQQFSCRNHAHYSAPVLSAPADHPAEWEVLLRLIAIVSGKAGMDIHTLDNDLFDADLKRQAGLLAPLLRRLGDRTLSGPERLIDFALRAGPYGDRFGLRPSGLRLAKLKDNPQGIDLGALAPRIPEALRTPSGKIELAPPALLADLKRVEADIERVAPEMVLIGRRHVRSNNSWMHNLPVLAKGPYRCTLLLHPKDAERLGLREDGRARVSAEARNDARHIDVQVEISDSVMPGVVSLPHGWGHRLEGTQMQIAAQRPGVNINHLLDENWRDPLSGNAVLSGVPVRIEALSPSPSEL